MKNIVSLLGIFLLFFGSTYAQFQHSVDSLIALADQAKPAGRIGYYLSIADLYLDNNPQLALKYSKETLIAKLESTLFQKALEGNTTALIFSLKNLAPNKWADKVNVSGDIEIKQFGAMLDRFIAKI